MAIIAIMFADEPDEKKTYKKPQTSLNTEFTRKHSFNIHSTKRLKTNDLKTPEPTVADEHARHRRQFK